MTHFVNKPDLSRELTIVMTCFICSFDIVSVVRSAKSATRKLKIPGRIPNLIFFFF